MSACGSLPSSFSLDGISSTGRGLFREGFVGSDDWVEGRADGVEAVRNDRLKLKVAFSNVDLAHDCEHLPKPRSRKGSGAERAGGFGSMFR